MQKAIEKAVTKFIEISSRKPIKIISHYDTDGITSATILIKALERMDRTFSVKIVKQLDENVFATLPKNELIVFLDLGSSSLMQLAKYEDIFIIDHHEIPSEIPSNITLINPHMFDKESISASGLVYLFVKQISQENKDLANLAVIGMVGDMLDKDISKSNNSIISDAELTIKKGLLFYPSTRPIHKTLEFSSSIFIPGVTGNSRGVLELLREAGIEKVRGEYKNLIELTEEENSRLITSILIRRLNHNNVDIIGNIYLVKFFGRLEDARELSAMINACSRLGYSEIAILLCLGSRNARTRAEEIYANYKQHIVSALNFISNLKKIEGKGYIIINARDNIKDTIIGTIASILSVSSTYEEGTVIVAMAYCEDKIKVSSRVAGRNSTKNLREILESVTSKIGGESGGHALAAGCLIPKESEESFLSYLKKALDVEVIKV
jgi:RecJ-like exonuclease